MAWAPSYVDLTDFKAYLKIQDSADDEQLTLAIAAASRAVDTYCRRQFGRTDTPETRTFTSYHDRAQCLWAAETDDYFGQVLVTVCGTAVTGTPEPINAPNYGRPYTRVAVLSPGSVAVSGNFGWTAVPDAVVQATMIQAARINKRRDSPFGVAGSPQDGSELRLLAKLDPDVQVLLAGYKRPGLVM
jgi:hypothetical protein